MKITGTENELRNFVKIARKRQLNTFIDTLGTCFDKSDEFENITFMDETIVFEIEDEQEPEPDYRKKLEIEYEERINQLERENIELIHYIRELERKLVKDLLRETTAEIIDAVEIDTKEELSWGCKAFIGFMIPGALIAGAFLLGLLG